MAFLSIVAWPPGFDRQAVAALLAQAGAMDQATLSMRLGRPPPLVLEAAHARAMAEALAHSGGDAFAFDLDDLARAGPTLGVADLAVREGSLDVELRGGLRTSVRPAAVDVLVRAGLRRTSRTYRPAELPSTAFHARSLDSIKAGIEARPIKETRITELLDVHTRDGTVYQLDGDRFGYRALGAMRGGGDKVNMDGMCELLAHLCPDAVVDRYFEIWRPPPGHRRLRLPAGGGVRDDPAFAFYSRWAAMTYRHVRGAS